MKILIIGSKGFIGSHCMEHFSIHHETYGCDVVQDYINSRYFLIDATDSNYSEIFQKHNFDVCINCSGAASVPLSLENPYRDFSLNVINVFRLLDSIRKYNPACRFITLSSAAVYGNPSRFPVKEEDALQPISPYGVHKKMAEEICAEFSLCYKLNITVMRIFSTYGPGLTKQIFWDVFQKTQKSTTLEMWGTGKESRDFIYIRDLVRLLEMVAADKGKGYRILNAASGIETRIEDVISLLVTKLGWQGQLHFNGVTRTGDPLNWKADITKITTLGHRNETNMESGIEITAHWLSGLKERDEKKRFHS